MDTYETLSVMLTFAGIIVIMLIEYIKGRLLYPVSVRDATCF